MDNRYEFGGQKINAWWGEEEDVLHTSHYHSVIRYFYLKDSFFLTFQNKQHKYEQEQIIVFDVILNVSVLDCCIEKC